MKSAGVARKRPSRPSLTEAVWLSLLAAIGQTLLVVVRALWPETRAGLWAVTGNAVRCMLALALPAWLCARGLRERTLRARLRLQPPTVAQCVLALAVACTGLLCTDDLTLLADTALQGLGVGVGEPLAASAAAVVTTPALFLPTLVLTALTPTICEEFFYRGVLFAAWERRGTAYAIGATAALFALLGGPLSEMPSRLLMGVACGYIVSRGGSLYICMGVRFCTEGARLAAVCARGANGAWRFEGLALALGGTRGVALLAMECALLGLAFAFAVGALCLLRAKGTAKPRLRPAAFTPMSGKVVFALCVVIITGLYALAIGPLWGVSA